MSEHSTISSSLVAVLTDSMPGSCVVTKRFEGVTTSSVDVSATVDVVVSTSCRTVVSF